MEKEKREKKTVHFDLRVLKIEWEKKKQLKWNENEGEKNGMTMKEIRRYTEIHFARIKFIMYNSYTLSCERKKNWCNV